MNKEKNNELSDWLNKNVWNIYLKYLSDAGYDLSKQILDKHQYYLKKYSDLGYSQAEIILNTISKGKTGFYKPDYPPYTGINNGENRPRGAWKLCTTRKYIKHCSKDHIAELWYIENCTPELFWCIPEYDNSYWVVWYCPICDKKGPVEQNELPDFLKEIDQFLSKAWRDHHRNNRHIHEIALFNSTGIKLCVTKPY